MSSWHNVHGILCVRLDNLGDVLMTTPAIRALRESGPDRRITLLASGSGARAAAHVPEIDHVISFDAPWMKHPQPPSAEDTEALVTALAARDFHAAVIFTVYSQSPLPAATLCHMAGIPRVLAHCRENPYHLLTDWVPETEPSNPPRHEVRRQLDLVAHVGARTENERLSFRVRPPATSRASVKLDEAGVDIGRPIMVVHPGATASSRRWMPERFAEAARQIGQRLDCQVVVTGDASERDLAESVRRGAGDGARSLAGSLSLEEFAAVLARASLVLSNNTGTVHLAAAVGSPVIDLYALTNPQHTPWKVQHRVLSKDVSCRNCYQSVCPHGEPACLAGVTVDEVVAAACDLWLDIHWRAAA
jgi:lipopolysaccharide heptosyltransferase II